MTDVQRATVEQGEPMEGDTFRSAGADDARDLSGDKEVMPKDK